MIKYFLLMPTLLFGMNPDLRESMSMVLPAGQEGFVQENYHRIERMANTIVLYEGEQLFAVFDDIKGLILEMNFSNHMIQAAFPQYDFVTNEFIELIRNSVFVKGN